MVNLVFSGRFLLPLLQSGFRQGHSTETAVLRVLSDLLQAVDRGDVAALVLIDLSAAFDTVDHEVGLLLQRLSETFSVTDVAHMWFRSYLSGRTHPVRALWLVTVFHHLSRVWCTAGVGAGAAPVRPVHC